MSEYRWSAVRFLRGAVVLVPAFRVGAAASRADEVGLFLLSARTEEEAEAEAEAAAAAEEEEEEEEVEAAAAAAAAASL